MSDKFYNNIFLAIYEYTSSYLDNIIKNHSGKFDENTLNIINEDKDSLDKFIMNERTNENYITKAYSYARKKQIYLNLYNIIKFVLKSYLITYLLTSHGQLVIFKVSDDDYIPKLFLSVFPKDLNTKDEEIYYINASIDTIYSINGTLDTSINKYYNANCFICKNYIFVFEYI